MLMISLSAKVAVALAMSALLAGCGSTNRNTSSLSAASTGSQAGQGGGVSIDWSAPLPDGLPSSADTAQKDGGLGFTPVLPNFGRAPSLVQVTNPDAVSGDSRAVAYVFDFGPSAPGFGGDGRVRLLEYATKLTNADLAELAANPPGPAANFQMTTVGNHAAPIHEDVRDPGRIVFRVVEGGDIADRRGNFFFGERIERRCCFVENQKLRTAQ